MSVKLSPLKKEAIYALPLNKQFFIVHIDASSGLAAYQHVLVDTEAKDYEQVVAVAKAYAKETICWIGSGQACDRGPKTALSRASCK